MASQYKRGIPLINIPTTLTAMVDASVGGKNAIDLNGVKNVVGNVYQPTIVCIDTSFLATLPPRELRS